MITDGILLIDKPQDYTSFDVVARMRGMLSTRKVGHAGTLDPMATGVLPIFVGRGTKCCDILPNQDKRYQAVFQLGKTTDTQDVTGRVIEEKPVVASREDVEKALERFRGRIQQIPPMYSAVQVNGKRLYELARQGIEVERKPREVQVYQLSLLESWEADHTYAIDVHCSKGTYIRTICHDIGQTLGCGAVLVQLRRTMAAGFFAEDCIPLEEAGRLAGEGRLYSRLIPVEAAFSSLPAVQLGEEQARMFRNGVRLDAGRCCIQALSMENRYRVLAPEGRFLGIAHVEAASQNLICDKLFATEESS